MLTSESILLNNELLEERVYYLYLNRLASQMPEITGTGTGIAKFAQSHTQSK
jgi:hypothetical protein